MSSATKGKRGQVFFKALLDSLDGMGVKRLITGELEVSGEFCALGVLGFSSGVDMAVIDPYEPQEVSEAFDIAGALAQEVMFMNDEYYYFVDFETPEQRWVRMRKWVSEQIVENWDCREAK